MKYRIFVEEVGKRKIGERKTIPKEGWGVWVQERVDKLGVWDAGSYKVEEVPDESET